MDRLREPQQSGCGLPEVGRRHDTADFWITGHVKAKISDVLIREGQHVEMRGLISFTKIVTLQGPAARVSVEMVCRRSEYPSRFPANLIKLQTTP